MFDLGLWELLTIVVLSLLVIKPEEIPSILKSIIRFIAKIKKTISEVSSLIDETIDETGVKEITTIIGDDGKEYKTYPVENHSQHTDKDVN